MNLMSSDVERDCYRVGCADDMKMQVSVMQTSTERTATEAIAKLCRYKSELSISQYDVRPLRRGLF